MPKALRPTEGPMFRVNAFDRSHGCVAYRRPTGARCTYGIRKDPEWQVRRRNWCDEPSIPDMRLHEIFVYDSRAPDTLWIDAKSCEG